MKTISTPNYTATITLGARKGKYFMDCSFWPIAQVSFFTKFESMFEVLQVSAKATRTAPAGARVWFRPTDARKSVMTEAIEALFLEYYEP